MLRVQVRLVAMRTWILAICVLLRYHTLGARGSPLRRWVRPTRRTWQDATPALRSNHMCRRLLVLHERRLLSELTGTRHARQAAHGAADTAGRHWPKTREGARRCLRWHCRRARGWIHCRLRHSVRVVATRWHHAALLVGRRHGRVGAGAALLHRRGGGGVRRGGRVCLAARMPVRHVSEGEAAILILQWWQGWVRRRVLMLVMRRQVAEGA